MGIQLTWDDTLKHVMVYEFSDPWTWDEFVLTFETEIEMAQTIGGAQYHVIVDVLQVKRVPGGHGISQVYSTFKRSPENSGLAVIVTNSRFIVSMFNIMKRVYPETEANYLIAADLQTARELINTVRQRSTDH